MAVRLLRRKDLHPSSPRSASSALGDVGEERGAQRRGRWSVCAGWTVPQRETRARRRPGTTERPVRLIHMDVEDRRLCPTELRAGLGVYRDKGDFSEALRLFRQSLSIFDESGAYTRKHSA